MQKKQVDKKKYMRKLYPWLLGMILGIMPCIVSASENDSIKVESLLQKAARLPADKRRFSVIDMRDNTKISYFTLIYN